MNAEMIDKLVAKHLKIITVESVTGGLLADAFVSVTGASSVFMGGFITYQPESKVNWLDIDRQQLLTHGTVSEWTVIAMMQQGLKKTNANLVLAVTGNAGPTDDGSGSVGDFFIGVMNQKHQKIQAIHLSGTRQERRHRIISYLENMLNDFLNTYY
jgi:PncC family amidohydrolase